MGGLMIAALTMTVAWSLMVHDVRISSGSRDLAQPYWDCVERYATLLESSGGSGEEILVAARHMCKDDRKHLIASLDLDLIQAGMSGARGPKRTGVEILAPMEEELRGEVILTVLAKRAKRADDLRQPAEKPRTR
jgi:hypothetical protein